jgi:uncharacterized coiled-coil DUF342 family protein
MKQNEHLFRFDGSQIAKAAEAERDYHKDRLTYWRVEQDKEIEKAKALTATVRVQEQAITGGKRVQVIADITGVQEINWRLIECGNKIDSHRSKADEYHLKAAAYGTQPNREYELDPSDVQYFRLAGGTRDD